MSHAQLPRCISSKDADACRKARLRILLAMWRLCIVLVTCLGRLYALQQQCPSFASLTPPSGFVHVPYLLTGQNLDAVANVTVTTNVATGTLNLVYANVSSDSIQINFTATDIIVSIIFATVTLSPVNTTNCSDVVVPNIMLYTQRELS